MTIHSCTLSIECQLLPLSGVTNGLSIRNISDFLVQLRKLSLLWKYFFKARKINFDTKDADTLACFSAVLLLPSGSGLLCKSTLSIPLIISANLSHLTEAKSSVICKAVHCVNKYINLGHSEPERTQCRKRRGNIVHSREDLVSGLWFSGAQMWWWVSCRVYKIQYSKSNLFGNCSWFKLSLAVFLQD